jgi:hypothetical protein
MFHSRSSVRLLLGSCGVEDTSWTDSTVLGPNQLFDDAVHFWVTLSYGDSFLSLFVRGFLAWYLWGRRFHGVADSLLRCVFDLSLALSFVWATWDCTHYPPDNLSGWIDGGPLVPVSLHVLHCAALPLL